MKFTLRQAAPGKTADIFSVECDEAGNVSSDKPEALEGIDVSKVSGDEGKDVFLYLLSRNVTGHYTEVVTEGVPEDWRAPDIDPEELPRTGGAQTGSVEGDEAPEDNPEHTETTLIVDAEGNASHGNKAEAPAKPEVPKLPPRLKRRDA
jgi:hypothetical protein